MTAKTDTRDKPDSYVKPTTNTTKDDIARLIHLFKEPGAQVHWTKHFGSLTRAELDARKSDFSSDAANATDCLASMFNDYHSFKPSNLMVRYNDPDPNNPHLPPSKVFPYEPSTSEWTDLCNHTQDIEPTNLSRQTIIRDGAWVKSTWTDVRKWLHAIFISYNRSGERDVDRGEWGSEREQQRWSRQSTSKMNTGVRFHTVMLYAISLLCLADFESMGRQLPSGTGFDDSVLDSTSEVSKAKRAKVRNSGKGSSGKGSSNEDMAIDGAAKQDPFIIVLNNGAENEKKMKALELILKYGSVANK